MEHLSNAVRHCLVAIFGASAMLHLLAPGLMHRLDRRTYSSHSKSRAIAVLPGLSALFLAIAQTHVWGIAFGALTLFMLVVSMLQHRRYGLAVLGMLGMTSLPVAFLSSSALH